MQWKFLGKKQVYENLYMGKIFRHNVLLPNKKLIDYYVLEPWEVDFPVVIPIIGNEVIMIEQYRYTLNKMLLEFPMGTVRNLSLEEMARRELKEETGIVAERWEKIGSFYPTYARSLSKGHVFVAQGLEFGDSEPEDGEIIEVRRLTLDYLDKIIMDGEIVDGNTLAAYVLFKSWQNKHV